MTTRIHNLLARRPEVVVWLVLGYFLLCAVLRILRSESLQNDEAEQVFQAQFLLMGYGRQPPFYNWLQYGVFSLFGVSLATLTLVKNGLLALCCLFYLLAARLVLEDRRLSVVAMLALLTAPAITVLSQRDLTHAVATLCLVSLFLFAFLKTMLRPSLASYLLVGFAVGCGIITKYNFVILPVAAMAAVALDRDLRARLLDWRIIPAIGLSALIAVPHLVWALTHVEAATAGTLDAMREHSTGAVADRLRGLWSIISGAAEDAAIPLLAFALVFREPMLRALSAGNRWSRLLGLTMLFSLLIVALLSLGLGASQIKQKWLSPFLLLLPLYLTVKLSAAGTDSRAALGRMAPPLLGIASAFALYLAISNLLGPMAGQYGKESMPYGPLLHQLTMQRGEDPAYIIANELMLAGNLRFQKPHTPVILPDFVLPVLPEDAARQGPGLIVWWKGQDPAAPQALDSLPASIATLLAEHGLTAQTGAPVRIEVPYLHSDGAATMPFGYAWVEPVSR